MDELAAHLWQTYGEAAGLQLRAAPRREVRLSADGWLALSGEPKGWLNYAYLRESPDAADLVIEYDKVIRARGGQVTAFLPRPTPPRMAEAAQAAGWQLLGATPLMVFDRRGALDEPHGYTIERVVAEAQIADLQRTIAGGFGLPLASVARIFTRYQLDGPGIDAFIAYRDGIAMSTVTVTRSGPLAGIFWVATPPEHRRQGASRAALLRAMAYAIEQGAATLYLAASDAGRPLYEQLGFRAVEEVDAWAIEG